jgi:hypothetical protein
MIAIQRFAALRRKARNVLAAIAVAVIMVMPAAAVQSAAGATEGRAAGEAKLRARMTGYWDAMQRSDYAAASDYVHPDSRRVFSFEVPKSRVVSWKIESLRFNTEGTACETVTRVAKPIPYRDTLIEWPLHNLWVLESGEWYFKLAWDKGQNPVLDLFRGAGGVTGTAPSSGAPLPAEPAAPAPAPSGAQRLVPDPTNPTEVHSGEKSTFRFSYHNSGSKALRIVAAHADCHCTGVGQAFPEVAPGASGVLEITLDTFGLPLGRLQKEIAVELSDGPEPVRVRISVDNLPNFEVEPGAVDFGRLAGASPVEREVRIRNRSGHRVKLVPPSSHSDTRVEFSLDRLELEPNAAAVVRVRFAPRKGRAGEFLDNLLFETGLEAEPILTLRVYGRSD